MRLTSLYDQNSCIVCFIIFAMVMSHLVYMGLVPETNQIHMKKWLLNEEIIWIVDSVAFHHMALLRPIMQRAQWRIGRCGFIKWSFGLSNVLLVHDFKCNLISIYKRNTYLNCTVIYERILRLFKTKYLLGKIPIAITIVNNEKIERIIELEWKNYILTLMTYDLIWIVKSSYI